ncbi:GNAT family N-acetyltransferase [Flavobacterium croceum]|uniref:GNAT family N-acetyltransferase n=1 Tax=Flavobacterium croceum TaxID=370975 RepID=UPI0024A872F4|nr:GNAT family N-acetyltransferase [Flavobacterium croceum]
MENLNWQIKQFNELSTTETYQILALRSLVFVVEQNCVYQDIDNKDQKAFHLFCIENNQIIAYARLFKAGDYFNEASIGRVVVHPNYRGKNNGHKLMQQAILLCENILHETKITISAQQYLKKFYETHGFVQTSAMYLEDDIPHIQMQKG